MSTEDPQLEIAGYSVERLQVGQHTLGYILINEDVTVVFRMADDGSPPSSQCIACRISKIRACADLVCPDIKENDPNASCRDAIEACTRNACQGSCKDLGFGDGGYAIIA